MPILTSSRHWRPLVQAVRQVRLGVPFEREVAMRAFYTHLLGFIEFPVDSIPGGWLAGGGRGRVYFELRHAESAASLRRRLAVVVPSLKQLETRLREQNWRFRRFRGLNGADDRLVLQDPAGHVLEVQQSQPF